MKRSDRTPDLRRAVEIALRESEEMDRVESDLRRACEDNDVDLIVALARRLSGLPPLRVS